MTEPENNARPFAIQVEAGKDYWWCSCGMSKNQPFCDGSHKGSELTPKKFTATSDRVVWFCGCKQARDGILCDGSHKNI
jgi:CDGSH iron-sulfur domain-containing protein 3